MKITIFLLGYPRTQIRQEKLFRKKNIFGFRQNPIFPKNWFLAKKIVNNEYKYFFSSEMNCPYQNVYSYKILSNLDIRIAKKKKVVFWPYLIKSTSFDRSTTSHKSPPILKVNILSQSTWFQLFKIAFHILIWNFGSNLSSSKHRPF